MEIQLSSYKSGNGLKELLAADYNKFWHTDDNLPHFIIISFERKIFIKYVALFLSSDRDDSYTPEIIDLWAGLTRESMKKIKTYELSQPDGYFVMDLNSENFFIYIVIKANHQEGRDSRIRHLKIVGKDGQELFYN